jgi:hypothetical protein
MMTLAHKIYIFALTGMVVLALIILCYMGFPFYLFPLDQRFFQPDYNFLKPGGVWGHGIGILGSLLIILGIVLYMARKRMRSMSRMGLLKHWLEFHIFLCTLGPVLILFHTTFKFGGLVAVSFWSMVAVFLSGIIGRFIYLQIPRTIEGRELSLNEVRELKSNIGEVLSGSYNLDEESRNLIIESTKNKVTRYHKNFLSGYLDKYVDDRKTIRSLKAAVKRNKLSNAERKKLLKLVKQEISLNRRIERLATMQNLFKYWHVAHLPFAVIMIIIMIIHVAVTIVFGYRWIF